MTTKISEVENEGGHEVGHHGLEVRIVNEEGTRFNVVIMITNPHTVEVTETNDNTGGLLVREHTNVHVIGKLGFNNIINTNQRNMNLYKMKRSAVVKVRQVGIITAPGVVQNVVQNDDVNHRVLTKHLLVTYGMTRMVI